MTTYRIEAIDADGATVHEIPVEIGTPSSVPVFQVADGWYLCDAELTRVRATLEDYFPDRRVLILLPGIRFVRFVPVTMHDWTEQEKREFRGLWEEGEHRIEMPVEGEP